MTLELFGRPGAASQPRPENIYHTLGFSRNPFRSSESDIREGTTPFYQDYIRTQLGEISQWVDDVHERRQRQPLAIVGQIGVGKTMLISQIAQKLRGHRAQKIVVESLVLSDVGYVKIGVGAWLILMLERLDPSPEAERVPAGVLPLIYRLVNADPSKLGGQGRMARALATIAAQPDTRRVDWAKRLSAWLQRGSLTDAQARDIGVGRRVDWEGELIPLVGDLFVLAQQTGLLNTLFLFIDQLEDLFGRGVTPVRRSRVLTDLRGLVDTIDRGAPIGLALSWTPHFDDQVRGEYPALYTRLKRRRVDLPLLERRDITEFTKTWIHAQKDQAGFDDAKQPRPDKLADEAWTKLVTERSLVTNEVTPRNFLTALAAIVDEWAQRSKS